MKFIKKYMFLSLLAFFLSGIVILAMIYLNNKYNNILEKNKITLNDFTKQKYGLIESYLNNTKKDLRFISKIYTEFEKKEKLENILLHFSNENDIYSQIRYLNTNGLELIRVNNKNKAQLVDKKSLQNKKDRYYFKYSQTLKENQIYLSPFDLNVENKRIERPINPTLRFSIPVYKKEKRVAYAILNYKGKELLNILKRNSLNISTILLNKESNYLLSTSNPEFEWNFMFKKHASFKVHRQKVWEKILNSNTNKGSFKKGDFYYSFIKIDPSFLLNKSIKKEDDIQWYLINYFNKSKVLDELFSESKQLFWVFLIVFFVLIFISYKLSYYLKRLEKANERINIASNAFENSQEGIFVLDKKGRFININKGFSLITGYSLEEVHLKHLKILKDDSFDIPKRFYKNILKKVYENGFYSGELNNKRKNKQSFISRFSISTIKEDEEIKYYVGVFSDITEIINQKKKIERTNEKLLSTLDNLKSTQEQLVEAEKLSALGQVVAGIAHEINSPLGAIKSSTSNVFNSLKKTLLNKPKLDTFLNEEEKFLLKHLYEDLNNTKKNLTIKEKRLLKKEIQKHLEEVGIEENNSFFADVFSSLACNSFDKYIPLLKHKEAYFIFETINDEFITTSNLQNIDSSVSKVAKTIFALKKFSHFDHEREGTYEKLETELENVLIILHHTLKQNIKVIRNYESLEAIFCHPDELGQIWMNLISNAIHAMNNKGTLTLSIYEEEQYQVVSIQDTGKGIKKEIQEKIFKPFFTTKEAGVGSGLGLGIVQKILKAHDGRIDFKSNEEGTTFFVKIPKKVKRK